MPAWTPRTEPNSQWDASRNAAFLLNEDGSYLLNEDGSYLLNEDGSRILLQESQSVSTQYSTRTVPTSSWTPRVIPS